MLTLYAMGRFRLADADGWDHAPTGSKARALLAMLSVAPDYSRTRTWLKDRLWSDRGPEQAAASLRNVLSEIRRALGVHRALLLTRGDTVSLDGNGFYFYFEPPEGGLTLRDVEPFEDIDVKDPEFEHYIRDLRVHLKSQLKVDRPTPVSDRKKVVVFVNDRDGSDPRAQIAAHLTQSTIEYQLRQFGDVEIFDLSNPLRQDGEQILAQPEHHLLIRIATIAERERVFQSISLETTAIA